MINLVAPTTPTQNVIPSPTWHIQFATKCLYNGCNSTPYAEHGAVYHKSSTWLTCILSVLWRTTHVLSFIVTLPCFMLLLSFLLYINKFKIIKNIYITEWRLWEWVFINIPHLAKKEFKLIMRVCYSLESSEEGS